MSTKVFFLEASVFLSTVFNGSAAFFRMPGVWRGASEHLFNLFWMLHTCHFFFVQLWEEHSVHSSCPITVDEGRVKCHTDQSPNPTCITATDDNKKHNNRTNAFKTRARRSNLHCVDIFIFRNKLAAKSDTINTFVDIPYYSNRSVSTLKECCTAEVLSSTHR